jgi:hypothetical protein
VKTAAKQAVLRVVLRSAHKSLRYLHRCASALHRRGIERDEMFRICGWLFAAGCRCFDALMKTYERPA